MAAAVVLLCAVSTGAAVPAGAGTAPHVAAAQPAIRTGEPVVCDGCQPPLNYMGGQVMGTTTAGVTVTPIFWEPSGSQYAFPSGYEAIVDNYLANVAAASGSTSNVYSVDTEYYQDVGGTKTSIAYTIHAGTPLVDTAAFPGSGCTPDSGYTECITDAQLRTELASITSGENLPTDLAHFYPVFLPPGVETMDADGTTSANSYCGYHRAFGTGSDQTVYGDLPIVSGGVCDAGQVPNGNLAADGMISTLSHELNEAITDPLGQVAWNDQAGHEIGDMCADHYGPPLGSTSPSNADGTEYNQVINGGKYYTQTEFSDYAFGHYGLGKGCAQSEALAQTPGAVHAAHLPSVASVLLDATPNAMPADGQTTATIFLAAADPNGYGVQGDHVHFSVGVESGRGVCGKLNSADQTTDAGGSVTVTFTASTDNVTCWVYGVESDGGQSAESVIYQGTTQKDAATFGASFPTSLQSGGSQATFAMTAANPSAQALANTRVEFQIFPGTSTAKPVTAGQVHLSYSTTGPNGTFTMVPLSGATGDGNDIYGYLGPMNGSTLAAKSAETLIMRVSLASSVPASTAAPLISVEAYLDQVSTASGSTATLADTYATDVKVTSPPQSNTLQIVLITIGAVVVVLAIIGVLLLWRRRRNQPRHAAGGPAAA